jgi:hypothetical protein
MQSAKLEDIYVVFQTFWKTSDPEMVDEHKDFRKCSFPDMPGASASKNIYRKNTMYRISCAKD